MEIALFVPCFIDQFMPRVALATARILEHLGHNVHVPAAQTCCGQIAFNQGHKPQARRIARHFLHVFADQPVIVAPSGSCVSMIRHHYGELFENRPEAACAQELAARVFEFTSFLVDHLGVTDLGAQFRASVTLHESCHATRELGLRAQPRALLQAVRQLELREMPASDVCCGFGGAFSVKYPEISTALADEKLAHALSTQAEYITGVEGSCLLHLQGRIARLKLPIKIIHIAELLARGLGLLE